MRVERLRLRDFRTYAAADVALGPGLTVLHGPNGAGKTNMLEALYFGCTSRSCRTTNEREVVRFGAPAARVEVDTVDDDGWKHTLEVGFQPGEPKRLRVDGAPVERLTDSPARPLVSVFLPDRLELVKGAPAGDDARKAIDALLSKDSQIELLKVAFRRPSRTDIKVSDYVKLPELSSIKVFKIDEDEAAKSRDAFLAEWAALPKAGSSE